jgi:hypothetical protein
MFVYVIGNFANRPQIIYTEQLVGSFADGQGQKALSAHS